MSLSRSFVQRSSRLASNASSSSLLAGSSTSSRQVINAARAQYRSYSNGSSSSSSTRSKTPVAFGLVGLGGLTTWLGFGDSKDPKTTQEGMLGNHPDVDYGQVYRDVGEFLSFFPLSLCHYFVSLLPPSRLCKLPPLLIGRHWPPSLGGGPRRNPWSSVWRDGRAEQTLQAVNHPHGHHTDYLRSLSPSSTAAILEDESEYHSHFSLPCVSFGIMLSEPGLVHQGISNLSVIRLLTDHSSAHSFNRLR